MHQGDSSRMSDATASNIATAVMLIRCHRLVLLYENVIFRFLFTIHINICFCPDNPPRCEAGKRAGVKRGRGEAVRPGVRARAGGSRGALHGICGYSVVPRAGVTGG